MQGEARPRVVADRARRRTSTAGLAETLPQLPKPKTQNPLYSATRRKFLFPWWRCTNKRMGAY
jgi:hypothetical protein